MSGKSSLALLVCQSSNKQAMGGEGLVVFNVTAVNNETFESSFEDQCEVGLDYPTTTLLQQEGCVVYLVVDQVEIYSKDPQQYAAFWTFVESILSYSRNNVRILMFGECDFGVENMIPTLGIGHLNYTEDEVFEYITKWFNGAQCLAEVEASLNFFCVLLKWLTGGNVGLCLDAIKALNVVATRNRSTPPSPDEWIHILQTGTLRQRNDLYETLVKSRVVDALDTLSPGELGQLERKLYGAEPDSATIQKCLRKGILVRTEVGVVFPSPVMGQYFVRKRFGHIVRAGNVPETLSDMIGRVMHAIDYDTIRQSLGKSASTHIPLESDWQTQFFLAAIRCTPETLVVSTNVGSLFGIRGFVDFSIHGNGVFWAFELLRERSNLTEHIERFSDDGRYSPLPAGDFCVIDFRRVDSIDNLPEGGIETNMQGCKQLFVVCYDAEMTSVVVFNSAMQSYRVLCSNALSVH